MFHKVGNYASHVRNQIAGLFFDVLSRNSFLLGGGQTRFCAQACFRVVTGCRVVDWLDGVFPNPLFNKACRTIAHGKASAWTLGVRRTADAPFSWQPSV